jgi:hypothetical protein
VSTAVTCKKQCLLTTEMRLQDWCRRLTERRGHNPSSGHLQIRQPTDAGTADDADIDSAHLFLLSSAARA